MIRVKGYPNLYRDETSGAIINCDGQAYNQYVSMINSKEIQKYEIDQMKKDIDEIKSMLKEILNGSR